MTTPAAWLNDGSRLGGVRVLVGDDARNVREVVTDILTQDGAKVTAVGSAEEALAALPPERGGVTPAAALTAYTGSEHRASVLRAGFQLHVEKPIGLDALIGVVAMLAPKERAVAPRV
jgi:CheY-like chemotaxis protein